MTESQMKAKLQQRTVKVGDREIFVSETGSGSPVIMLHGGGPGASGLSNYSKNIDALAEQFRVIIPDMPGYGQSTKGLDQSDAWGDISGSMVGLMDAMNLDRASIVGNSLGGGVALRMAMDEPDRVNRLVLMGPGGIRISRGAPTKGLRQLIGYYRGDGPSREKLDDFIKGYLVADASLLTEELLEARYQASLDPEVVANPPLQPPSGFRDFFARDLTRDKRFLGIEHPILALWGDADKVNKPSGGTWMQKNMKNCDLYTFAGIGHWVQWERADEFNAVCAAFLAAEEA